MDTAIAALGTLYPELVLTNSHDGASSYKIDAGIFRLVCLNGMVVGDRLMSGLSVRHKGGSDGIIEASYEIVDQFPKVLDSIEKFSRLRLEAPQAKIYAEAALSLRYDDGEAPINAEQALRPRRREDADQNLFNVFNTVQEHLTQGGLRGRNPETRRRVSTRPVSGIAENTKLNKALWQLTERMRELVS